MTIKTWALIGLCAVVFGAGLGVSNAEPLDLRCQSCQSFFQACIAQCNYRPENSDGCYAACIAQRRACVATFCSQ
jgi:hypothetical protein